MWLGDRANQTTRADWFTRSDVLRRIAQSSRVIAGKYRVRIGQTADDILKGKEGWCDHSKRLIWVNPMAVYIMSVFGLRTPEMNPMQERAVTETLLRGVLGIEPVDKDIIGRIIGSEYVSGNLLEVQRMLREWMREYNSISRRDEWLFTQYVAFHERLHERFTYAKEKREQNLLGSIWNMLEDERIERIGSQHWLRVAWFVKHGNEIAWKALRSRLYEMVRGEDPVRAIGNFTIFTRFAFRAEELSDYETAKREVRPEFHEALDECWPHILRAWNECENATEVKEEAQAIVDILRKHFPQETEKAMGEGAMDCPMGDLEEGSGAGGEGEEGETDENSGTSPGLGEEEIDPGTEGIDGRASKPEMPGESGRGGMEPGKDQREIVPSDYHGILADPDIAAGVNRLRDAFDIPDPRSEDTKIRNPSRGRLDAKSYRKTNGEKPFIRREHRDDPGRIYVELLGDWSGSMASASGSKEAPIEFMRKAGVMVCKALQGHKRVRFNFRLMPGDVHVATNHDGEDGLMRCAGVMATGGTEYAPTFEAAYSVCLKSNSLSMVLLIADGQFCGERDKERTKKIREKCERKGIIVKVLYVQSRESVSELKYAFGKENVILVPNAKELPGHIEAMVSSVGAKKYQRVYV